MATHEKDRLIRGHVVRSTASNFIGQAVVLGTGFLLTPFILAQVGAAHYGLWVLINAVTGYGSVLEFGIAAAVVKYVAEYRVKGDGEEAGALVATALSLYTVLGLLALVFSVAVALFLPHLIDVAPGDRSLATQLVLISGVALGISIPATTTTAVLRGLQRFDLLNVLTIAGALLNVALTLGVLLLGWGIRGLAAVSIPLTLLMQVPSFLLIRRIAPEVQPGWRKAQRRLARQVTRFGVSLFAIQIARQLQMRTDEVVIGASLPVSSVTPYSFGRRLGEIPNLLANQFIRVLMPLTSGLEAEDDRSRVRVVFLAGTRLALAISVAVAGTLIVLAAPLLSAWIGPEYAGNWPIVLVIGLSSIFQIAMYPAGAVLQGIARHRILAWTSIGSGIVNLALSLLLVRRFGLVGVAVGTLVPSILECVALVMPYTLRILEIALGRALRESVLPALLPAIPMVVTLYALLALVHPSSLIMLGLVAAAGGLVYALVYLCFGVAASERRLVLDLAARARAVL